MDFRLVLGLLFLMFGLFPLLFFFISKNKINIKTLFIILVVLYSIVVFIGVLTNIQLGKTIYIAKSCDIDRGFNFSLITKNIRDITINICMFIPFGFLLSGIVKKHKISKCVTTGLLFSIFIELMQLLLPIGRNSQLTDIILNTISCLIGVIIFKICELIKNKKSSVN